MEGPFEKQEIYTLSCRITNLNEAKMFETILEKMGVEKESRPMYHVKKKDGDPMIDLNIICVKQPGVHNVFIDCAERGTGRTDEVSAQQMYSVLQLISE